MENPCIMDPEIVAGSDETCCIRHDNLSCGYRCDNETLMRPRYFGRQRIKTHNEQHIVTGSVDRKTHSEPCKRHAKHSIEFYCDNHSQVGCTECMLIDHSTCNRESIEEAAKRFRDNGGVARLFKKIHELDFMHTECMQRVQQLTQSVEATYVKTENAIKAFASSFKFNVDETARTALAKADKLRIDNEKLIDKLSTELKGMCNSISSFKDNVKSRNELKAFFVAMETEPMLANFQERLSALKNENNIAEYKFHQYKLCSDNTTLLLGEVVQETEEADEYPGKFEQMEEKYQNECAKIHSLEQRIRDRDERIEKMTLQLNEVRDLNQADSSKMGIFVTQEGIKVKVYKANILRVNVDCIASASNKHLHHGRGIARFVANAAGKTLVEECKTYILSNGTLPVGQACSTTAGKLHYKCVIHANGPMWRDYDSTSSVGLKECEDDLMQTVLNSFYEAESKGMQSIALPAIGSAMSAVPLEICVNQYVLAVKEYSSKKEGHLASALSEIHFIDVNKRTVGAIQDAFIKGVQPLGFKNI